MSKQFAWLLVAALITGCAAPSRIKVVMPLRPDQVAIYKTRIIKPFEKSHKCIVDLEPYPDPGKLASLLTSGDTVDLVSPPLSMTRTLVARNLITSIDQLAQPKDITELRKEYFLMDMGAVGGKNYFLPRYVETPVLIYLKSRVNEAVLYWEIRRDEINRALIKYNGKGLPRAYALEKDPSQWDWFDLFVVGYFWSTKEIQGQKRGRVALGPLGSPITPQSLMDNAYQSGAGAEALLSMNDPAVFDMFQWQSVLAREGVLNPGLVKGRWTEEQVREGFRSGELFLSAATQLEAFLIHGTGTPEMPGFLANPEDMGVALMPKGNSLSLDVRGEVLREGRRSVGTRSYWWGVTRQARNPALAFELAHYLSNTQNQIIESAAFGMIPVRQDLLGELGLMFGGGWTSDVFQTASQQLVENRLTVAPLVEEFADMSQNYLSAYEDICLPGGNQKTRFEDIQKALEDRWIPRQRQILGSKYPARALSAR